MLPTLKLCRKMTLNLEYAPSFFSKISIAVQSAVTALADPTRQDSVAALGEVTGLAALSSMRSCMLLNKTGRRILRTRPLVNLSSIDISKLENSNIDSFGFAYAKFLDGYHVSPETRVPVVYIQELSYIMLRYRQIHDFLHVLTGLEVTVSDEIALKWFEMVQTGLPSTVLSAFVGPLRLDPVTRAELFDKVPWMIENGAKAPLVMNIFFEELFEEKLETVRKLLNLHPYPPTHHDPNEVKNKSQEATIEK